MLGFDIGCASFLFGVHDPLFTYNYTGKPNHCQEKTTGKPKFSSLYLDEQQKNLYNPYEVISMTISQKIKMALAYKGMSEAELARSIGTSPSAFNQRMKTGKFSTEEMEKIAEVLEADYYFGFSFKDGTKI